MLQENKEASSRGGVQLLSPHPDGLMTGYIKALFPLVSYLSLTLYRSTNNSCGFRPLSLKLLNESNQTRVKETKRTKGFKLFVEIIRIGVKIEYFVEH